MGTKRQPHERSPPGLDLVPASQRRRLSFSNSDLSDPRQLQALYERCLDQVLRGLHPVSRDTAIRLAAIQCFVQFGPYQEGMERSSIRAYNLLPKEYVHAREHEKNIAEQYRNLVFPDEVAARRKYCEICKNLPTYGMIFFEVKEPDGNKLVSRLFGVNKDCVMSVDRKTKIVRKSWPLEQLRRWAASPTIFTIDFGDYQDGYYSVRTLEGDKIKRLIAEFVDIILKKRQIVDPFGLEGDEGAIMIEDYVLRARSVPLSMVDVQNRLGSPLVEEEQYEVVPPQVPQQQPQQMPFEPRGPFGPLADLLPAEFPQAPLQQPIPPIAKGPPEMPLFDQQHVAMPVRQQPVPAPRQLPPILDQYDQLLPLQQPPVIAAPFSPQQVPVQKQPPLGRQPLPAASPPAFSASPPPAQPAASQSLPPSLVNSIHQQQQPLTSTASSAASISAFTSHEISYEICYKDGLANRYFQQHFQSTRNLQALGGAIDSALRRVAECRSSLGTFIAPEPLAMSVEERESAIQLGEDTIRHRAIVFLASTAQAIEWTSEYQRPGPKYGQAQVAISQAGDNLCELIQCTDELSALVGNAQFSQQMYSLVQSLCDAFTGFLAKLHPNIAEKRSTFLSSASLVGESAFVLLNALNREEGDALEDQQFYVALNEVIQAVANTTANLVLQAKSLPETPGEISSEPLIQAATQVALYTSELIALARVLAAIMAHPACQKRVQAAVARVRLATIELLEQSKQIAFGQFALTGSTDNYARMQRNALDTELALQQLVQQTQA